MVGKLRKNDIGRWEIVNEEGQRYELTSGDVCEVKVGEHWLRTRIECGLDSQYYAVLPGIRLYVGMPARDLR